MVIGPLLFLAVLASAGAAYEFGRAPLIAQVNQLLEQLGLQKPIETEGFVLTQANTLALTAKINKRSIQSVIFRPLPGKENEMEIYKADSPQEGFETVRAEKTYPCDGTSTGKRITPSVEFIPFADLPKQLLPAPDALVVKREILLSPMVGIVLDPSPDPVALALTDEIHQPAGREDYTIRGISHRDGTLYVLIRPVEESGLWYVQNFAEGIPIKDGDTFFVPCKFSSASKVFEVVAVVMGPNEKWPYSKSETMVWTIPPTKNLFGPVRVTVIRDEPRDRPSKNE